MNFANFCHCYQLSFLILFHSAYDPKKFVPNHAQTVELAVSITYIDPDGEETTVDAEIGQNLLHVAHDNNVELEGAWQLDIWKCRCDEIHFDKV